MKHIKRSLTIAGLLLLAASCGGDKNKDRSRSKSAAAACETNRDCGKGFACLANKCAAVSTKAIINNPSQVVTPQKVKDELQKIQDKHSKRIDEAMD